MKTGVIYCHINKINKKIYIGKTTQKPEYRWNHGLGYTNSTIFFEDNKKYGWDNFDHIILEKNIPENLLNERENFWINFYKSNNLNYGYNIKLNSNKEDKKDKILQWQKNNPLIARKSIDKMKEYWINHPNEKRETLKLAAEKSKEYWENNKDKKIEVLKIMHNKAKEKNSKPVICIETNKVYPSAREAFRETGIHYVGIGKVCNGKAKTAGHYHWKFLKKGE